MRLFSAISTFLPIALGLILVIFIAGRMGLHHLYHWQNQDVYNPNSPSFDALINHKKPYFDDLFFWGRTLCLWVAGGGTRVGHVKIHLSKIR